MFFWKPYMSYVCHVPFQILVWDARLDWVPVNFQRVPSEFPKSMAYFPPIKDAKLDWIPLNLQVNGLYPQQFPLNLTRSRWDCSLMLLSSQVWKSDVRFVFSINQRPIRTRWSWIAYSTLLRPHCPSSTVYSFCRSSWYETQKKKDYWIIEKEILKRDHSSEFRDERSIGRQEDVPGLALGEIWSASPEQLRVSY